MKDPGFDWSLKGFTAADMAAVGETIGATDNKVKNAYVASSMSSTGNGPASKKQKTKDEAALEHEKELLEKEQLLMDENRLPSSEVEFDRLIAGRPNSSELWIRYISFFCAQKDIVKAREIAERALTSIYFRYIVFIHLLIAYATKISTLS
ncbi:hypothetical protein AB6A40_010491 [Gnathostoma spinigerum]|uniref:Uncharacterized protein n=1 Tax=Gnathostoma spinigerum TaxID=75299 RepID=A0ABD6F2U6_9BILA